MVALLGSVHFLWCSRSFVDPKKQRPQEIPVVYIRRLVLQPVWLLEQSGHDIIM